MSRYILSTAVTTGRNAENAMPRDGTYVRCWNCHQVVSTDRNIRMSNGSHAGDGVTQPSTQLDGAVLAGAIAITVDSTTGFATPATGSITAFASGGRNGTLVTTAAHGLKTGKVIITGTTNYNGTFPIDNITTDTFNIHKPYVDDDATGTWTVPHYIYIHDISTRTDDDDAASTQTIATGSPRVDKVLYTAIASTTSFTTATATVLAHDDDMYVKGDTTYIGCPFCGCLHYDQRR